MKCIVLKIVTKSFYKNISRNQNVKINTEYHIKIESKYKFIIKYANYTLTYFLNSCQSKRN